MWFNDIIAIRSFMQTCALLKRDITRCISMVLESRRPVRAIQKNTDVLGYSSNSHATN